MPARRRRSMSSLATPGVLAMLALLAVPAPAGVPAASPIAHVFVIVLENKNFQDTFGPQSAAPYLARELPRQGVLLEQYFATGHYSLDNYLAMISGQAASLETRADCEAFADFHLEGMTGDGQAIGHGCVYPASIRTLADQLDERHRSWRAYLEDMGNDPQREARSCGHPALDATDGTQLAEAPSARVRAGDQYATRHNPFVYFHSIIDSPRCATHVLRLEQLARDLRSIRTTPDFAFIAPNLCSDGHDAPCVNGQPGGLRSIDAFLREWVPRITASPAFRRDGLLVVTFDEGEEEELQQGGGQVLRYPGEHCCNQQPGPNIGSFPQQFRDGNVTAVFEDFGGERTGTVLLSRFLRPGSASKTPFNHYSLLKSIEDIFRLKGYLGYAGQPGLTGFFEAGSDIQVAPRKSR
jgi:hypothetical protein